MDKVVEDVEMAKQEWDEAYGHIQETIKSIEEYGKSAGSSSTEQKNSLPRLNGIAQDGLALLTSLQFKLDILAPQLPRDDDVQVTQSSESWKQQIQSFRLSLRNANLQAKANMRKAAKEENYFEKIGFVNCRGNFFWEEEEKSPQFAGAIYNMTKAGMTSAAESITERLRRTHQPMVQEVERSASALATFEESTGVLRKAESEYKGHRSLLVRTRNLLSTMQRQDILDRIILVVGFLLFFCAVLYVVSKCIGIIALQRQVTCVIKVGMGGRLEDMLKPQGDGINLPEP